MFICGDSRRPPKNNVAATPLPWTDTTLSGFKTVLPFAHLAHVNMLLSTSIALGGPEVMW